jgi:signal transduction histidine kinase
MSEAIVDILRSGRRRRVPTSEPPDEFDALAGHFNQLLDENEVLVERTREVTNEIAHDLRTPLSHMRTHIDAALAAAPGNAGDERVLHELRGDVDRILDTFNALLHIAQVESGRARDEMQPVDLTQLATDACDLYEPAAEEAGLTLEVRLEPGVRALGHAHLLAQALTNLLENALKYAGSGVVTVSLERHGDEVVLAVSDQGPGIPEAERSRVLQRFVRLETSRSRPGAGLGLAFVAAVARLHDAALVLEDARPGLRVALVLASAPA